MAPPAERTRTPRVARPRLGFTLLGGTQVTLIAAITVITVGLPALQRELGLGDTDLIFVSAAYGVSFGGLLLLGGRVADLLGHRRMFLFGVSVFGLSSAAAGLAPGFWPLVAARFVQGVGAALTAPATMALLRSVFPDPARHARALAVWGVFAGIGATLGNVLSGVIVTWASWRWVFLLPAAVSLAVAAAAVRLLPPGPPPARHRVDMFGAVLVTGGLSVLIAGLARLQATWILVGVGLLGVFAATQARSSLPLVPPSLLAKPRRAVALVAIALTAACMTVVYFLLALYFQRIGGYSPLLTSAAFAPPAVAILTTGPLSARLLGRFRPEVVMAFGLLTAAAGLLPLAGLHAGTAYGGRPLTGLVLFALGAGLSFSAATVCAIDGAGRHQSGLTAGVVNTVMEIGPPVGLAVLVPIASTHAAALHDHVPAAAATAQGYGYAFGVAAVALASTAGLALLPAHQRN
jgi:MFS family permease